MEIAWILFLLCILVSWTDVRTRRIPNRSIMAGLLLIGGIGSMSWTEEVWMAHFGCGVGIVVTFGAAAFLWPAQLGMGDVKLLGVLGFALGLRPFVWILTVACLLLLLVSLAMLAIKRMEWKSSLPFAPFVTLGLLFYQVST